MEVLNLKHSGYKPESFVQIRLLYEKGTQKVAVRRPPFKPYCFIRYEDREKLPPELEEKYEYDESDYVTFDGYRATKVLATVPRKIRSFREAASAVGIVVYEADVPYTRRVMIDEGITVETPESVLYWDIEVDSRKEFPDHENPHQRIILIGAIDHTGKEFAFCDNDEVKMLTDFIKLKNNYDATSGWFSAGFDIPYLTARAKVIGLRLDNFNFPEFDLLKIYKRFFKRKQQSYALSAVVEKICGYEIEDWGLEGTVNKMYDMFLNDKPTLIKYCLKQIKAVRAIDEKLKLIDMWCQICKTANLLPYATRRGRGKFAIELPGNSKIIDNLVLKKAVELGEQGQPRMVFPSKAYDATADISFVGGYVEDPKPGIWNYTIDIDAAQQYPAIIKTFNIGIETYCDKKKKGNIIARHGSFKQEPKSMLAQIVKTLSDERYKAKLERNKYHPEDPEYDIWDKIQFGKKFITNSVYGICGFPGSRYFKREVAENITSYARAILLYAKRFMADSYTTLYGDTDSIFMLPKFKYKDVDDLLAQTEEKLTVLNASLHKAIHEQWKVPEDRIEISFEYDTVFEKLYLTSKKKCYAGKVCWQNGAFIEPYIFIRGFETVRSSTLMFTRNFQSDIFEWLLSGMTTNDVLEKRKTVKKEFMSGAFDDDLFFLVGLNKPIDEYHTNTAQVKAAKKMIKMNKEVRVGDKIKFVRGAENRIILPGETITGIDRKSIWNNYVEPVFKRLDICGTRQTILSM